jgi:gamma-glutamylcyclotransferase (GGCT)/AIG2-like uncharacterized protein YtfP
MHLLFVYGTLKKGCSRSSVLESSRFIGVAKTTPNYKLYDCGTYPALVENMEFRHAGDCVRDQQTLNQHLGVWGELYEVGDSILHRLDQIESVDVGLYKRAIVNLSDFSLVNLPFSADTVDFLEKKTTISYVYLHDVSFLEQCGAMWSPR